MNKIDNIEQKEFDNFIYAIGSEIEQAQVKLISAANIQMLLHYWKIGNFILYNQKQLGWGSKVIDRISQAIRGQYPDKKGYSTRNLKYMCQFARLYPLEVLAQLHTADKELETPTLQKVMTTTNLLNEFTFGQEVLAQIQTTDLKESIIGQQPVAQIQDVTKSLAVITQQAVAQIESSFIHSSLSKINWASHIILMNSNVPLGIRYWYMKQAVEFGWSRNVLDLQIKNNLFQRQIEKQKVNNFTAILPQPQSDLANYLLKDPYIFDLAGVKEAADERDIENQLVTHITMYLLEMGTGFAFVARQKHF